MSLKINNEIVHTTATETIMQNTEAFTAGTNGAIQVMTENIMGDLEEFSMLADIANLIGRRDVLADGTLTPKNIDSRDENNVKMYWSTGAIEFKYVDATRYGSDSSAFSSAIGEQIGKGIVTYMLNQAISATRACIEVGGAVAGDLVTGDGTAKVTHALLNESLKPFGDARDSIVAWVMKGSTYADLVDSGLGIATSNVAGGAVNEGSVGSLGRPVYTTDSAGLNMTAGVAVLGLTVQAIKVVESAVRQFLDEVVGGNENLKIRIQSEGEFMLNAKGYSWKTASGINPTETSIGTPANWEQKASDVKSTAGVIVNVLA